MSRAAVELARGLIVRPLVREKTRTLLTLAGIAVGIAVIVAIQLANASSLRAFRESVDLVSGKANWQITPDSGVLEETTLLALRPLWGAGGRFAPVIDVEAALEPSAIPVRILGVDLMSDLHFRDYRYARIVSEDEIREVEDEAAIARFLSLFEPDSAVLPERFARERGLGAGSPLLLFWRGRERRLVVRGLLRSTGPATAFEGAIVVLDVGTAQRALDMKGQLSRIDLLLPEPLPPAMRQALESALPAGARLERPSRRNERVDRMLRAFRVNLMALAAVSLLVGVFLVYNTVLISILRRRRDIGIFKTLGVGPGQILAAFVAEGAIFGLVGSVLGILLGWILAFGALDLVGRTINQLYVATPPAEIELTGTAVLSALLVGLVVSVAAAVQPAWEASRVAPTALIRPGLQQRVSGGAMRLLPAGAIILLALGALLTRLPAVGGVPVWGYASVLAVVAGFSLLAPPALLATARAVATPWARWFGVPGRLATASIPASLRRTSVATAALTTAIAMMVSVAIMIGSFRETVDAWVGQTVQSDLWVRPARMLSNADVALLPPEVEAMVRAMPEVDAVDRFRGRDVLWREQMIMLGSGDFRASLTHGGLPMVAPRSDRAALEEAIRSGGVLVSETLAMKERLRPGMTIDIPAPSGTARVPIAGIYRDYSNDRGVIVMDRRRWEALYGEDGANTVAIYLREDVSPDEARARVEARLAAAGHQAFVLTNATIRREVMTIFDQTFVITWALLGVALAVAVLGIVNTLAALILERRREISLLRVLGTSRGQIAGVIVLESAVLGLASAVLGTLCGWALSWILIFVINRQSFGWTIEFDPPLALVALSVAATFLATVASGLVPARLAARESLKI